MNKVSDFEFQQKERLIVEQEIKYWAGRFKKVDSPALKREIPIRVKDIINSYETQIPAFNYHMARYERLIR